MSIYNNKHVVFEQVGLDADAVVWNQSTNTDTDNCINNYEISNIRNTVLPTKALALSSELYATLTNTTIQTAKNGKSTSLVSTSDKTFILAQKEITTTRTYSVQQEFDALTTLGFYVSHTQDSYKVKTDPSNMVQGYWLRSAFSGISNYLLLIGSTGSFYDSNATSFYRVSQCFAY